MTKMKMVLPGDLLSTSEELLSGDGTYEENGNIRAARIGWYFVNEKTRTAIVKPVTSVPTVLHKGDRVLAQVESVRSSMVIANVVHVIKKERPISGDTNATLHISEISTGYIKDPEDVFSLGDIFKAKIIQVKPSVQLSTKGDQFGVIKALCTKCRYPLKKKGNILECPRCGNKEKRKTAIDYGKIDITAL